MTPTRRDTLPEALRMLGELGVNLGASLGAFLWALGLVAAIVGLTVWPGRHGKERTVVG